MEEGGRPATPASVTNGAGNTPSAIEPKNVESKGLSLGKEPKGNPENRVNGRPNPKAAQNKRVTHKQNPALTMPPKRSPDIQFL